MLANELIALLERVRSAEQMLYTLGAQSRSTIDEFERANAQRERLLDKLRAIDEA